MKCGAAHRAFGVLDREIDLALQRRFGALSPDVQAHLDRAMGEAIDEEFLRAGRQHRLTGGAIDIAVRGADFGDIRPAVVVALERIGMTYEQFLERVGGKGLIDFADDLPTRYVTNVPRSAKHRQGQQQWKPNDLIDIVGLPVPSVYCDVLVTEKQWAHQMRQGKVPDRYSTTVLSGVDDLVEVIVSASILGS